MGTTQTTKEKAAEYALLAAGSYFDVRGGKVIDDPAGPQDTSNKAPIPEGWEVLTQFSGSGENNHKPFSGFSARVYKHTSGEICISYAGTEFNKENGGRENDFLKANIPMGLGFPSKQADLAAELYIKVRKKYGAQANISFTGHSLGGGLASMMAVLFNEKAYTFATAPFEQAVDRVLANKTASYWGAIEQNNYGKRMFTTIGSIRYFLLDTYINKNAETLSDSEKDALWNDLKLNDKLPDAITHPAFGEHCIARFSF